MKSQKPMNRHKNLKKNNKNEGIIPSYFKTYYKVVITKTLYIKRKAYKPVDQNRVLKINFYIKVR